MARSISARLQPWLEDYGRYHRTRGNELCHCLGIPAIVAATLGLLGQVRIGPLDLGLVLWALASLWYWRLDWRLGLPFSALALGLWLLARAAPPLLLAGLFAGGWVLQFFGHLRFEKQSPAFLANLRHLLIGPLWIYARGLGYIGF